MRPASVSARIAIARVQTTLLCAGICGGMLASTDRGVTLVDGGIIAAPSSGLFMQSGALEVHKFTFSLRL